MKKSMLAGLVALGGVAAALAPAEMASATTITPGSHYRMYTGAGSGSLGDWKLLGRTTSTDASFKAAKAGVWVYGDSITRADYADLAASLTAKGVPSAVDAQGGLPTLPAVDRLAARVARQGSPRILLMATGSNDIFRPTFVGSAATKVRALVGPGTKIVWVNTYVKRTRVPATMQTYDLRNSMSVNTAVTTARVNVVVDWSGFLRAKASRPGAYLSDGVHTTPLGRDARNALILAKIAP
ncbi:hypothetical protein JNB_19593 [Janibacter sp. HTCC2649]|uniref:SGNH/GDSL hydrolase family protein n=1 Tax=Janibacter sp. HTCC2649 TaxID=313589 RepID=UPI0000670F20|nr:SGNH/GDSL hydrolase family protein [Janibacter sp. HTCC2649]EAP97707.1 hypothetical protein JNB_19593 [Janibacter sp. HTCC2649]